MYYQQQPMPYQNYQAQQRQEQLDQVFSRSYTYNYARDITEAQNWPIAPGNHLVFEDVNGTYFYTKSLGFAPNDRPAFTIFKREEQIQPQITTDESSEVESLKNDIKELKKLFEQFTAKQHFEKKGGGK